MKICLRQFCIIVGLLFFIIFTHDAYCQSYVEYKIQINTDNSAYWVVTVVSSINSNIDIKGFQERVTALVTAAANETGREMSVDENSLQMIDEISWDTQSRKTIYSFIWQNFSVEKNGAITLGDVFHTPDFFKQLYGDGTLQITYPETYNILSVSPHPDEQNNAAGTIKWLVTEYFIKAKPEIILQNKTQNIENGNRQQFAFIGISVISIVVLALVAIYMLKRQKSKNKPPKPIITPHIESDEEKIIKLIHLSNGSIRQSVIAEKCGFSKAKTSQILSALEQKGTITRYKRGRDKIVILNEQIKGK
ncbi:MAG: MarR family transcriptional regulator [Candidatus Bathyarchaeia archaeon]